MSLNTQVAKSVLWMVSLRACIRIIGLISTIILARLLTPEEFGLVAIIMAFFAFIEIFGSFGFDTVLIQKQNATAEHYNTAWSFNFSFAIMAFAVVMGFSGLLADFYGNQKLQPIMFVLSFSFLVNGLRNIGVVDFRKNLTFDKEFSYQMLPKIISFFCTIGMAFWLRNYWALVIGSLIWQGCTTINSYLLHSFRPRFTFAAWRELFNFSKWLMFNNFLYFANTRSPEIIIGKILSPQAAGLFTIAKEISTLPTTELASNVNRATYPGYSKISHHKEELKKMYLNVMESISFIVVPAGVGIASIAGVLVPVVLGEKWLESVTLIQYIAIGGTLMALNSNTGYVFLAMGKPKLSSLIGLLRLIIFIPTLFWLTFMLGLEGTAIAVLLTTILMFVLSNALIFYELKISIRRMVSVHFRPVLSSLLMFICVYYSQSILNNYLQKDGIILLLFVIGTGIFTYTFFIISFWTLFRFPEGPEKNITNIVIKKFTGCKSRPL
ncbi:lipopolysaccharide biosynthesis protein [Desulfobacter postgatei]|uniref:Membrane protein involved in the export of O-antigen and teichoic acid n=1 Tax=Desulfobacter postgatei 2ac9 TaxID=879212 RepID=I5B264_9BACT|nr:lipopolysaccharide biosynthesis protein [Desulfobacter postgatei]EIM63577.1 membrane protein involved in the export of O-antigen and teichoic acid [Desulfobacter postgatei 2ac9]